MVTATPDGIGIGQLDGEANPSLVSDCVYWNYECNIEVNYTDVLVDLKKTESQTSWTNNYAASGDTSPLSSDKKNPYPYCDFVVNTLSLGNHSFGDADWIQDYNSHSNQHWYLWWNSTTYAWNFKYNTTEPGYNYVPEVCDPSPF